MWSLIQPPSLTHLQRIQPISKKKEINDNENETMKTSPLPIHVLEYNWGDFMQNFKYIEHYTVYKIIFVSDIDFKMYFKSFHIQRFI